MRTTRLAGSIGQASTGGPPPGISLSVSGWGPLSLETSRSPSRGLSLSGCASTGCEPATTPRPRTDSAARTSRRVGRSSCSASSLAGVISLIAFDLRRIRRTIGSPCETLDLTRHRGSAWSRRSLAACSITRTGVSRIWSRMVRGPGSGAGRCERRAGRCQGCRSFEYCQSARSIIRMVTPVRALISRTKPVY